MTPVTWYLIGEDAEAMAGDTLLPLDWRTKAQALKAWAREVGEPFDLHHLHRATVHHGVRCWAPPGEYYGDQYYDWSLSKPIGGGWIELQDYCYLEDDDDFEDAIVLDLDRHNDELLANVRACAAPEIHLVSAGDGWPWWSRVIGPATIVVL